VKSGVEEVANARVSVDRRRRDRNGGSRDAVTETAARRLAAILAADVAGYSRLMGANEEGTLARLKAHRRELIDPKIAEHRGRIVKTTGDGMLVEFASVVDAVRCAAEIQRGMLDRGREVPDERQIRFRIGVNLGDIIVDGGDIFGDGVNIAARLEALAEPGGICVSRVVQDEVRDKLPYVFDDLGEQRVKNIARALRVYALRPQLLADLPLPSEPLTAPMSQPASAPRLSIVVLPFANLSNDPEQKYFADGITEDLTTDLSRLSSMLVISRNTGFTYRDKPVDTRQVGRELGVRYVLEGSVRRSGNHVRVNAQLIDTHLWADRFGREVGDLLALQDEVTSRIAIALGIELIAAEAARTTENPDALCYYLWGRAAAAKPKTPANHAEAIAFYEAALALDPQSMQVRSWLAIELAGRVLNQMTDTIVTDLTRADELVEHILSAAPRSWLAHFAKAQVLRAQGRFEEAIPEYETVIELNRNAAYAFSTLGQCKLFAGSLEEAIPLQMQFIRLSPRDPLIGMAYFRIGATHLLQSRTKEAIVWLERARNALPEGPNHRALLASAYALEGEIGAATAELAVARKLSRDGRLESIARVKAAGFHAVPGYFGVPKVRALFETTYFEGLRKAGIPEE
jgi:TolB-like protein/class 3 adenylate cyclase/Tfp pilus assembly protein PilF